MYELKTLEWHKYQDIDGVYAAPEDLKWRYSIIVHENGKVEFALLDSYFEYAANYPQFYTSVVTAQKKAVEHYISVLKNFIL
ncbi:MAG: hypothetical protein K0R49_1294 [Burkholderiales bacterium]|jgi:hypothetical protein|nr:hypothetical protein [Burkholderiales bacterium]MCE3269042.1 hypothetical protein [Burkholderiales bacterium]